ncbi:MAG: hypothetical protein R3Y64_10115, partial [Peptostreptococcaceae bacterium]
MKRKELVDELKKYGFRKYSKLRKVDLEFAIKLIKDGFKLDCVEIIMEAKENKYEIEYMLNKDFSVSELKEISSGFREGVSVSIYANNVYSG